ncbi:hypothetical protein [Paraflavitalea pollutisoli]|uniref:hypothetical protein n=1 Tax=Paraflavitalea pollutisoli TaxID=3034143 RepID=UPI0023EC681E|nr:hypothetical protein [Paraflavitalea sp. H1-2-19X]
MTVKRTITCFLLAALSGSSCQFADKKDTPSSTTDSLTAALTSDSITNAVAEDPDLTDTIPVEKYNVHSISQQTAELVRNTLTTAIFKNELPAIDPRERKFIFEEIDLNGDGKKEIFVGFDGTYFCGTGGCRTLLLSHHGKLITSFSVTEYPVIVRPSTTQGWKDLVVGTASARPSMHLIKWNGKKYPGNPSTQPRFTGIPSEHSIRILSDSRHPHPWFRF